MGTAGAKGGGCDCVVVLKVVRWTLADITAGSGLSVRRSCAICAAHQVLTRLPSPSPVLLSCCGPEVSGSLRGEQTLNVNEKAERKLIFSICLSLMGLLFFIY